MKVLKNILATIGALATLLLVFAAALSFNQNIAIQVGGEHNKIEQKNEPHQNPPNSPVQVAPTQPAPELATPPKTESPSSPVGSYQNTPAPPVAPQQIAQSTVPQYQAALPSRTSSRSHANTQYAEEDCSCPEDQATSEEEEPEAEAVDTEDCECPEEPN